MSFLFAMLSKSSIDSQSCSQFVTVTDARQGQASDKQQKAFFSFLLKTESALTQPCNGCLCNPLHFYFLQPMDVFTLHHGCLLQKKNWPLKQVLMTMSSVLFVSSTLKKENLFHHQCLHSFVLVKLHNRIGTV